MNTTSELLLFKVLGHPERYAILRRLMAQQATLSQLGQAFHKTPAHIRHHLKILEQAGLVEFVEARRVQGGPEKYYRATQRALFIHQAVLPETPKRKTGITIGSMDAGIEQLAVLVGRRRPGIFILPLPLSSLDGLIAVRQGLCQMSTCHLVDPQSGEYNRSFVRRLFPGQPMALVQIYRREEGLLVQPGNPFGLKSLDDLARPGVRLVNREPGSGVRQWLDLHLKHLGLQPELIAGYADVAHSHQAVAQAVQSGRADAGIGIAASAGPCGLDFVPLFEEPYEIAVSLDGVTDRRLAPFFDYLSSGEFRMAIRGLAGYAVPQNAGVVDVIR
ncbi:MAG: helix-turn-helix domain-containing protein [Anaerolineales bacterium]|nr:helix-turn-helix domain-containing protein [Anaerolineales bacterium]